MPLAVQTSRLTFLKFKGPYLCRGLAGAQTGVLCICAITYMESTCRKALWKPPCSRPVGIAGPRVRRDGSGCARPLAPHNTVT